MYLWQRLASKSWWEGIAADVQAEAGTRLALIQRPERKRLIVQISCQSDGAAKSLQSRFGGRVVKLGQDWSKQYTRIDTRQRLRVGDRLVITDLGRTSASGLGNASEMSRHPGRSYLVIPAGAAFGTGQHSTTAMSLRMLEQLTRSWTTGWMMADVGTGSGILALAAKRFGAGSVAAIDLDPLAISTAKANARLNHIRGVTFDLADVRTWQWPANVKLVTANLFSELLIQTLPKLRKAQWLILSGIMRNQETGVQRSLKRNKIDIVTVRRRGKWIAVLARTSRNLALTAPQ